MPNNETDNGNSNKPEGRENQNTRAITLIVVVAAILFVGLALIAWYFVNEHSERIKFLTVNALSLFVLAAIAVQALIYRKQAETMERQWKAMTDQLDAINKQEGHLLTQAEAAKAQVAAIEFQADIMRQTLEQTQTMVFQNAETIDAMNAQAQASQIAAKAAEDNAKTARDAFHVGEAPYFGITAIGFHDFQTGYRPRVSIGFMNGGKTPAWHFYAMPVLVYGDTPETGQYWHLTPKQNSMAGAFYPSGEQKQVEYTQAGFELTEERLQELRDETAYLFVVVTVNYSDRRKVSHPNHTFKCIWNHRDGMFEDYEAA